MDDNESSESVMAGSFREARLSRSAILGCYGKFYNLHVSFEKRAACAKELR